MPLRLQPVRCCASLFAFVPLAMAQDGWLVDYKDIGEDMYEVSFSWDHTANKALVLDGGEKGGKSWMTREKNCEPTSTEVAPQDGIAWWAPRFFPRQVPEIVTKRTGITFGSVDWQPCGHKDIVICHAESHWDFHLYYVPQTFLPNMSCANAAPTCPDVSTSSGNVKFFSLMKGNMPATTTHTKVDSALKSAGSKQNFNFCVDVTSGMPQSGIHYGDKADTLGEWKHPVTIMGSHDCKLTFFEPMISWRWVTGQVAADQTDWPVWESGNLTYDEKRFQPLPTWWRTSVTADNCRNAKLGESVITDNAKKCRITVTIRGKRCPDTGCAPIERKCSQWPECVSQKVMGHMDPTSAPTAGPPTAAPTAVPTAAPTAAPTNATKATPTAAPFLATTVVGSTAVETVKMAFTLQNIDYAALASNSTLHLSLVESLREGVAEVAGAFVSADMVKIVLVAGSVSVLATITPPSTMSSFSLQSKLKSSNVQAVVAAKAGALAGIDAVRQGPISASAPTFGIVSGVDANTTMRPIDDSDDPASSAARASAGCPPTHATSALGIGVLVSLSALKLLT